MINHRTALRDVELRLERVALDGTRAAGDAQLAETSLSQFSTRDLLERLDASAGHLAAVCRGDLLGSADTVVPINGGSARLSGTLRIDPKQVYVSGTRARRMTRSDYLTRISTGNAPTDEHPAYVYEDGALWTYPAGEAAEVRVITVPEPGARSSDATVADGVAEVTNRFFFYGEGANGPGDEGLPLTLGSESFHITRVLSGTRAEVDTDATLSGTLEKYVPSFRRFDDALKEPLVALCLAQCAVTRGRFRIAAQMMRRYQTSVQPYLLPQFDLTELDQ